MFNLMNQEEAASIGKILPNTLIHGDCLEVMKYIPDGSVDLVLCVIIDHQLWR